MRFGLLNNLKRAFVFGHRHAGKVRDQRGVSVPKQALQLLKLALIYRTDPAVYYALNLYEKPHRLDEVEHYLGRQETKNGLYSLMRDAVSRHRPQNGHSLSHKTVFTQFAAHAGLPPIRIL